jgi:uncharacterized membrane protein
MSALLAAAAYFVLIHLLVSGTRLRDRLVQRIGEGPYMGLFSLASVVGLYWLAASYGDARADARVFWGMSEAGRWIQIALQLPAMLLVTTGLTTRNPTSVRQESALSRPDLVQGVLRITRHPFLWGVALWAAAHLLVNGDAASLVLFGSLLALAVFGTFSIDAKRKRALGADWEPFAAQTSNIPFAAGRRISLTEIGWWRILLGTAIWAALLFAHPHLFGAPALP